MSKKYLKNHKIIYFFYPGNINTKTGGYIYEKNIIKYAKRKKLPFKSKELSSNYPFPLKEDLRELKKILLDIPSIILFFWSHIINSGKFFEISFVAIT